MRATSHHAQECGVSLGLEPHVLQLIVYAFVCIEREALKRIPPNKFQVYFSYEYNFNYECIIGSKTNYG
jgi:hypothetical protein